MRANMKSCLRILIPGALTLALAACATVPAQLQGEFTDLSPARIDSSAFGQAVRWGGNIITARNEADRTCFEVLSRELDRYARPRLEDRTGGRFIACKQGFFDPEVFAKGREVTLTGQIESIEQRKVEEFDYRYPVVAIDDIVLWEEREDVVVYSGFHDPFWYPYYWGHPYWSHYPYWGPYPFHRYPYHFGAGIEIRKSLPDPAPLRRDDD